MMKLKIGGVPEHFNLPWRLAMEEGDFAEGNISLHWEDMAGGTGQMIRGLENKSIDDITSLCCFSIALGNSRWKG